MLPFVDTLLCAKHGATIHSIYFRKFTHDGVEFHTICEKCRNEVLTCGLELVDAEIYTIPVKDWWDFIPLEDFCEIAN